MKALKGKVKAGKREIKAFEDELESVEGRPGVRLRKLTLMNVDCTTYILARENMLAVRASGHRC